MKKLVFYIIFLFISVSATAQIKVGVNFTKNDPKDNSYNVEDINTKGGFRAVPAIINRDSILNNFPSQLKDGMIVFVRADSTYYQRNFTTSTWDKVAIGKSGNLVFTFSSGASNPITLTWSSYIVMMGSNPTFIVQELTSTGVYQTRTDVQPVFNYTGSVLTTVNFYLAPVPDGRIIIKP